MDKPNLFDKKISVSIDEELTKNSASIILSEETAEFLDKKVYTPNDYLKKLLRGNNFDYLMNNLMSNWKKNLPDEIHLNCVRETVENAPIEKNNCHHSWLEFSFLYLISGTQFNSIIERNKRLLRNNIKEKLALIFFKSAFVFKDGKSYFQVGEMCRLVLKEGLKGVSDQLKQMETKLALQISQENYTSIRDKSLFEEDGYKDEEDLQKEFWNIRKEEFEGKLRIEECSQFNFIDYFVRGIKELQIQGDRQECIKNIREGRNHEAPFRNYFKAVLSQNYDSVEAEPEKENGRIDLKISDKKLQSSIIIEFKGWWNNDICDVSNQIVKYLTDFESIGYTFIINHLKKKNIVDDYKSKVVDSNTNYVPDSWTVEVYKNTGFNYYSSKHVVGDKEKTLFHFVYNAY